MPLYECRANAENRISIPSEWRDRIALGPEKTIQAILEAVMARRSQSGRTVTVAFDGWHGIDWDAVTKALLKKARQIALSIQCRHIYTVFKPIDEVEAYKQSFITDDPSFGLVNTDGRIQDLMVPGKLNALGAELRRVRQGKASEPAALIVYGPGAAIDELTDAYDLRFYFDKTRQPILWEMWDGKLIPFGRYCPKPDYGWKEYYYCDYYLLDRQKEHVIKHMDFWVEGISFETLKLMPREVYEGVISTLVRYPIKEVTIFQPGPWGAYRYKDLFDVPGLECNAWNELAGPELSILVDISLDQMINMPMTNLMQQPERFIGRHIHETYPGLFPLDVWLDDGYFPEPTPAERTSMPIHNHPSTDYVRQHFKEPLGRYETYYIAEAYEGANTWLGYKDDADLEEWERKCRESNNQTEIPNWRDYIANWPTNVGDLLLIPPGTVHGHGGNQMVLEMDTCPSIAATEYSFFLYDYARPSWDDTSKTMTGKKVKMHLDHAFDTEKWVRASWAKDRLVAKPCVIKWTKDYWIDRYSSDPRMPFEIERLHFTKFAEYNTQGKFLHIVTLTVGDRVLIRSKTDPELSNDIVKFQSAIVPACFGAYEFVNTGEGLCTVVLLRWKNG